MIYAIIAAGGTGSRMGRDIPKQFIKIGDKTILEYAAEKFISHPQIDKVIILCGENWVEYTKGLFHEDKVTVIPAGKTRNETLLEAVRYIEKTQGLNRDTYLVTHDAARPFVTEKIITDNIDAMLRFNFTGTAIPATDTIFCCPRGNIIRDIPDRSQLYQAQTPQCFPAKSFLELYTCLTDEEKESLTDACKIFTMKGYDVHIVNGDASNIKITYPYDLITAKSILSQQ